MARPIGTKVTKDNSRKLYGNRKDWMAGKKLGRPKQAFDAATKTWSKA